MVALPPASHAHAGVAETEAALKARAFAMHNRAVVLEIVQRWPGLTAGEIGKKARDIYHKNIDHVEAQRRISELKNLGAVVKRDDLRRICTVKHTTMAVWVAPNPDEVQEPLF